MILIKILEYILKFQWTDGRVKFAGDKIFQHQTHKNTKSSSHKKQHKQHEATRDEKDMIQSNDAKGTEIHERMINKYSFIIIPQRNPAYMTELNIKLV